MSSIREVPKKNLAGATLAEYLVSIGVSALVLLVVASLSLYSGRSFAGLANYVDLNSTTVLALNRMTQDIRQTAGLTGYTTNRLTFNDGTNRPPLIYEYSPSARALTRVQGSESTVLLKECDSLQFSIYQRTPIAGTYDQYPTANATNCKVVEIKWNCSRAILGAKLNTESGQSAKIVIRKH
jgi:Tfp pilus assembly protein PilW